VSCNKYSIEKQSGLAGFWVVSAFSLLLPHTHTYRLPHTLHRAAKSKQWVRRTNIVSTDVSIITSMNYAHEERCHFWKSKCLRLRKSSGVWEQKKEMLWLRQG